MWLNIHCSGIQQTSTASNHEALALTVSAAFRTASSECRETRARRSKVRLVPEIVALAAANLRRFNTGRGDGEKGCEGEHCGQMEKNKD